MRFWSAHIVVLQQSSDRHMHTHTHIREKWNLLAKRANERTNHKRFNDHAFTKTKMTHTFSCAANNMKIKITALEFIQIPWNYSPAQPHTRVQLTRNFTELISLVLLVKCLSLKFVDVVVVVERSLVILLFFSLFVFGIFPISQLFVILTLSLFISLLIQILSDLFRLLVGFKFKCRYARTCVLCWEQYKQNTDTHENWLHGISKMGIRYYSSIAESKKKTAHKNRVSTLRKKQKSRRESNRMDRANTHTFYIIQLTNENWFWRLLFAIAIPSHSTHHTAERAERDAVKERSNIHTYIHTCTAYQT